MAKKYIIVQTHTNKRKISTKIAESKQTKIESIIEETDELINDSDLNQRD